MEDQQKSYQQKLEELEKDKQNKKITVVDKTKPYLTNLNEDPLLNFQVNYSLDKVKIKK